MLFEHVHVQGIGVVDAPDRVTSDELEEMLGPAFERLELPRGLLRQLTGVRARHLWSEGVQPSEAAARAAERAIEDAGVDREKIGVIVNTSVSKDYIEPSVASTVHGLLGLAPECMNYDLGNACLAFLNGMELVGVLVEREILDYGLVVAGESSREVIEATVGRLNEPDVTEQDFKDNFATLTLGSGAAAVLLARDEVATRPHRFRGGVSRAATQHNHLCRGTAREMITDASGLLRAGVELASETFAEAREELDWSPEALDVLVLHQVGSVHTSRLIKRLELQPERAQLTYPEFGNIGPAAIPITLGKALEDGRVNSGDRVALMGIGSGLNCSMMEVVW
jgi:3-oxoacyl-[acyl-carrier-protein] synthase-3